MEEYILPIGAGLFSAWLLFSILFKFIRIVPEQQAWIVEEFGKYKKTLGSGLHFIIPFIQNVPDKYKLTLKEEVIDVRPQECITKDNVQVTVDGILYLQVVDAYKAAYGVENYRYATSQIAQTTMRSAIGKIELDNTFSERDRINDEIVKAVDEASDPWGIKVTRYEIKNIEPSRSVIDAMEQQMTSERERRAEILDSEGKKQYAINVSKGAKERAINLSKAERQKRINEAEGKAKAIESVADATAEGLRLIAEALQVPHGKTAMSMRIAEQYIGQLSTILKTSETTVLPLEAAQIQSILTAILPGGKDGGKITPQNVFAQMQKGGKA